MVTWQKHLQLKHTLPAGEFFPWSRTNSIRPSSAEDEDPRRFLQFLFRSSILGAVEVYQKHSRIERAPYEPMGGNHRRVLYVIRILQILELN
jgi:hypothetical protein